MTATLLSSRLRSAALVAGLGGALVLRLGLAGADADASTFAGLVFAGVLIALSLAAGWRPQPLGARPLAAGVVGAAVICAPTIARAASDGGLGRSAWHGYPTWAAAVTAVAAAEEILLRGSLYTAVREAAGDYAAIATGALLFAAMHVVLNGGHAFALDVAVGAWLGVLRMATGGVAAPATAHVLADLAAWWLR